MFLTVARHVIVPPKVRLIRPPSCLYKSLPPFIETTQELDQVCTFLATYIRLAVRCVRDGMTVTGYNDREWSATDLLEECYYWGRLVQGTIDEDLSDAADVEDELYEFVSTLGQVRDARMHQQSERRGNTLLYMLDDYLRGV